MRRLPPLLLLALIGLAALMLGGFPATAAPARAAEAHLVEIRDLAFAPATITIRVGDSVTWTNFDDMEHTATSASGAPKAFDTGLLALGQGATVTFDLPGNYPYLCTPHPFMTGTVVVEPAEGGQLPDAAVRGAGGGSIGPAWAAVAALFGAMAWAANVRQRRSR